MSEDNFFSTERVSQGPLTDELSMIEDFTRDMADMMTGILIPVEAIVGASQMLKDFDPGPDENPDLIPIMAGVRPVALLWRHTCPTHGDNTWYLVPMLRPDYGVPTGEAGVKDRMILITRFAKAVSDLHESMEAYRAKYGTVPE